MTTIASDNKVLVHERIVAAARLAPSAENVQPWQFQSDGDRLTLFLERGRMLASDVGWMLAYTSLGACLENAVIAARELGYEPSVKLEHCPAPVVGNANLVQVALLEFDRPGLPDRLFPYLKSRCTCRRMDAKRTADQQSLAQLSESVEQFEPVRIDWLTEPSAVREIAALIGQGNRMRFEHEPFHGELYRHLRFSETAARRTCDGLDVATLQLPFGVARLLFFLRKWPRMRLANMLGFSRSVALQAAQEVRSSSAVGVLTVEAPNAREFFTGGRAFERLWLTATSLGLALHPTASLPVFLAYAERTDLGELLPRHARMARAMKDRFYRLCPSLRGRVVQMAFRLGCAAPPATRSLRRPLTAVLDLS